MKNTLKALLAVAALCQGFVLAGCDSETHPDPHLVESANGQRQAMQPGQQPQPPTSGQK